MKGAPTIAYRVTAQLAPALNVDDTGWKEAGERYTWLLQSGRNTIGVRAVNKLGVKGHPSSMVLNHTDAPLGEYLELLK